MVNVILNYLPIALFLSNNHPEMYCIVLDNVIWSVELFQVCVCM